MPVNTFHNFFIIVLAVLCGIPHNNAEIVRPLGKKSLQLTFLGIQERGSKESEYNTRFAGPLDAQAEFNGDRVALTILHESSKAERREYGSWVIGSHDNYDNWLTLTSNSTRERLMLMFSYNYQPRFQMFFIEGNCEIGIEKLKRGILTEYKGTMKNCGQHDVIKDFFSVSLRNKTNQMINIASRYPEYPETIQDNYLKYVDTYRRNGTDNFYAFLNYDAMKADDVTLEKLRFELWVSEKTTIDGDAVAGVQIWQYDII